MRTVKIAKEFFTVRRSGNDERTVTRQNIRDSVDAAAHNKETVHEGKTAIILSKSGLCFVAERQRS